MKSTQHDKEKIEIFLKNEINNNSANQIVIIPEFICVHCNSLIFSYIEKILESERDINIFFLNQKEDIFKILPLKYKHSKLLHFVSPNDSIIIKYPTILYLKNNEIKKMDYQNIRNPFAMEELLNKITK